MIVKFIYFVYHFFFRLCLPDTDHRTITILHIAFLTFTDLIHLLMCIKAKFILQSLDILLHRFVYHRLAQARNVDAHLHRVYILHLIYTRKYIHNGEKNKQKE
ncbi:hypothetical protein D3C72_1804460 [compost metagenome]